MASDIQHVDPDTSDVNQKAPEKKKSGLWLWIVLSVVAGFILWLGFASDQEKKAWDSGAPVVQSSGEEFMPGNKRPVANYIPPKPVNQQQAAPVQPATQVAAGPANNGEMTAEEKMAYLRQRSPVVVKDSEPSAPAPSPAARQNAVTPKNDGFIRNEYGAVVGIEPGARPGVRQAGLPVNASAMQAGAPQTSGTGFGASMAGDSIGRETERGENERFYSQARNTRTATVRATPPQDMTYKIFEGKLISGTLETAISSDLPGRVRAVVDEDVYGEHGRIPLIPRGSKLIGQYNSQVRNGQSRALVVWTRLQRPDGSSIDLGSYGTDGIGRSGVTGSVDNHFFRRFGSAALLSLFGAAVADMGGGSDSTASDLYRLEVARSIRQQTNDILSDEMSIPPTISVPQGERIRVFVAQDLDFSAVAGSSFESAAKPAAPAGRTPVGKGLQ